MGAPHPKPRAEWERKGGAPAVQRLRAGSLPEAQVHGRQGELGAATSGMAAVSAVELHLANRKEEDSCVADPCSQVMFPF